MADKTVNELPQLTNPNFSDGDFFLVWDESTNQSCKFSVAQYRNDVLAFGLTGGNYNGTLDATQALPAGTYVTGDWFFVDVAGTIEGLAVDVHDIIKHNGTEWQRVPRGVAVAANSRQTILSSNASIAADGEQPIADPTGTNAGWYYKNSNAAKINWYFYGDTNYTTNTFGDLAGMYAIVEKTAGYLYFTMYTKPTGTGDASWYKSRITWDDDSGVLMQGAAAGRYVVHTAGMDVSSVEPATPRIELPASALSSVGVQAPGEEVWLMALSTSSAFAAGANEFTVEQFAYKFGEQSHAMDLVGVKADEAETDPLFTASFKGNFANEAALPVATAGQWAINDTTDTIWIYDGDTSAWVESAGTPAAPVADVPYVYSYGDDNGTQTGYGWMNANMDDWNGLPNGNLQADSGSFRPVDAPVKFATLKSPGDKVSINGVNITNFGTYYYRHAFLYLEGGSTPVFSTATYNDIGSGTGYYVDGDDSYVFGHNCWVNPYFGTSSYAGGMGALITNYAPADKSDVDLMWEITDQGNGDYRLVFSVDGNPVSKSSSALVDGFATNGIDLYVLAKHQQIWPQPSGDAPNDPNPPAGAAWPGPHTTGADFDSVNNRIRIPGAHVNAEGWHPDDNSAFSVSAQLQFDGSISKRYPLYTTAEMSFDIAATSYYGYMQTFSHDAAWSTGSDIWYDTYDKSYNSSVNSMTYTWTGKDSGKLPRHGTLSSGATQHWMRSEFKGFYDETTKIFTPDTNGAYVWQYAKYPGSSWSLGMNAAGNWTRFLSNYAAFTNGGTHNYNQTIINQAPNSAALIDGEKFPHGFIDAKSGWQVSINGELLASKMQHGNNPVNWLNDGADAFIGMRSYNSDFSNVSYGGGTSMNEWTLTSDLEQTEITSLHSAMDNAIDLRTWRDAESGVTMHIYYPMADVAGDGTVEDYSGNGYDGVAEGID
jgi:hypothetical protein